jgi:hypothetical protein
MKYPAILGMTFAVHEAYRRLGIPSEHIHVVSDAGLEGERVMVVAEQGDKMFAFDLGDRQLPLDDFERQWKELVPKICDGTVPETQLQEWFYAWLATVDGGSAGLVLAMKRKGFAIGDELRNLN